MWAPYICLCIFTFSIHLLVSATIQMNPISITVASWNAGQVIFVFSLWDRDEMSNLYIRPSIVAFTKFWFIWLRSFRGEYLKKSANQKQESPVATMFVNGSGWNEQSYRGPSIDASYHVSVHLAKLFQSRRLLEIDQSETRIACGGHVC